MPDTCRTVVAMKRTLATLALVAVVGCSGGDTATSDTFNRADVEFVQGMIPHHEDAVRMANMVVRGEVSDDLADLADAIRAAQEPEIAEMRALLAEWGVEEDPHAGHMSGDSSMHGMMSSDDYAALGSASGADFERMWYEMMIEHHQGAIDMADTVVADGKHPRVRELAKAIITAQRDEISRMRDLLDSL
jgi:uncharacterized protein (DUF305 family)